MSMGDDREANVEKAFGMARTARKRGAELIVFPELFNGIYFCKYPAAQQYNAWAEPVPDGPLCTRLAALAPASSGHASSARSSSSCRTASTSTPRSSSSRDGSYLGKSRKMHIPETGPG